MNRRQWLCGAAITLLLAGCGGGSSTNLPGSPPAGGGGSVSVSPVPAPDVSETSSSATDSAGNLYRVTTDSYTVSAYNLLGQLRWQVGGYGSGNGRFDCPASLGVGQGRIYVVDRGNSRIQVLDANSGATLLSLGATELRLPRHVALTSDRVLVSDAGNNRIAVFDLRGNLVASIGAGYLRFPRGVAVDNLGRVWVADNGLMEIAIFDLSGNLLQTLGSVVHPHGLAVDLTGNVLLAEGWLNAIKVFSPQGTLLDVVSTRLADGRAASPVDVAVAASGQWLVRAHEGSA